MKCFNEKNQHIGELVTLQAFLIDAMGVWAVVKWCPKCGAVVIDEEIDDRRINFITPMRFPEITEKELKDKSS